MVRTGLLASIGTAPSIWCRTSLSGFHVNEGLTVGAAVTKQKLTTDEIIAKFEELRDCPPAAQRRILKIQKRMRRHLHPAVSPEITHSRASW